MYREYIKTAKNGGFCEELLSENGFQAVLEPLSVVMTMLPTLLKQFRILLQIQIKKIITNASRMLQVAEQTKYINQLRGKRLDISDVAKKSVEVAQKKET